MNLPMNLILDLALGLVLLSILYTSWKRGFMATAIRLAGTVAGFLLASLVSRPAAAELYSRFLESRVEDYVRENLLAEGSALAEALAGNGQVGSALEAVTSLLEEWGLDYYASGSAGDMSRELLDLLAQMGGVFPVLPLVAGIMGFCLSMSVICAPSISLEGRCLWILREAPVGESVLLWGKAGFQMLLTVPCTLAAVACLTWALALPVWQGVVLLAGLLAFDVGHACFGMLMGLAFPKLDAANDTLVIKQSMAVMLAMFLPMLGLALSGGVWWLADMAAGEAAGPVAAAGTLVLMAAACAGILSKRGPRMLRAL